MSIKAKIWTVVISIIIICGIIFLGFLTKSNSSDTDSLSNNQTNINNLLGRATCLPHKDKTGPQTLECALGLLADSGKFYALDGSALNGEDLAILNQSERVKVSGLLVLIEAISSDRWDTYDIVGIMKVTKVENMQ